MKKGTEKEKKKFLRHPTGTEMLSWYLFDRMELLAECEAERIGQWIREYEKLDHQELYVYLHETYEQFRSTFKAPPTEEELNERRNQQHPMGGFFSMLGGGPEND